MWSRLPRPEEVSVDSTAPNQTSRLRAFAPLPAVTDTTVSVALVREEGKRQQPIYYVSRTLLNADTHYPMIENLALALVSTAHKLRLYFQWHPIVITTAFPLWAVLHKPKMSGRPMKWAVKLGEFDITYQNKIALKSLILADFIAEMTSGATTALNKETP